MRTAEIYVFDKFAGNLVEDDYGTFTFQYDAAYLRDDLPVAVSSTMPLKKEPYASTSLFPFFDGLIPEGWLLDIAEKNWKLDSRDRMGLLLACCSSSIGAVSVRQGGDALPVTGERKLTVGQDLFKAEFEFPYSDDEINEMARNLIASRISVSGVQPKLSVHLERGDGGSSRITIVGFEGDYILKLPSKEYPCLIESEAAAMTLAGKCGIKTAQFLLARLSGGCRAYVTRRMDRNPQIKQDLNCFGGFGQQGYGYHIEQLRDEIGNILGVNKPNRTILIGAGNLGRAIATHMAFENKGFKLIGIFDKKEALKGQIIKGLPIRHIDDLDEFCRENLPDCAILCIPEEASSEICNTLIHLNIKGFWNFSHYDLALNHPEVAVENVHLGDSLMKLSYKIKNL